MRRHATRSVRGGFGSLDLPISAMRASSGITPHAQGIRSGPTGWAVAGGDRRVGCALQGVGDFQMRDRDARRARDTSVRRDQHRHCMGIR
jgi:hypothetical protein